MSYPTNAMLRMGVHLVVVASFLSWLGLRASAEATVYVTMISQFDRPWAMTSEDIAALDSGAEHFTKYDEVLRYVDEYIASKSKPAVRYVTASELRETVLAFDR